MVWALCVIVVSWLVSKGCEKSSSPWLSLLWGWGSLTMSFLGNFAYIYMAHHFMSLQLNRSPLWGLEKVAVWVVCHSFSVNLLDIHFDLVKEIYQLYKKPNDDPLHRNKKSNHPTSILQQLPKSISKRTSEISSNEFLTNQFLITKMHWKRVNMMSP